MSKLPATFYVRDDVVAVGRGLLGKALCTRIDGRLTRAIITEIEAYAGITDRASHAYGGRRTPRTEPMYAAGGVAYVYLCYGIHHLFNVVTGPRDDPKAVLVRAGQPLDGVDTMLERRRRTTVDSRLLGGPGSLAQALGIHTSHSGIRLTGRRIWIEDVGIVVADDLITAGPRIGIDYAREDRDRPYRFVVDASTIPAAPVTTPHPGRVAS